MVITPKTMFSGLVNIPSVLALVLLGAAIAFYILNVKPAEERLAAFEVSLAKRIANSVPQPVRLTDQEQLAGKLEKFYGFFDRDLSYADWLARFYDMAEQTGVVAQQAEYRRVEPAGVPLVLHEVSIPMSADYARIRAFAEGVLNAIPVASLDQITFRRQQANQPEVQADLRFSFYLPNK